MLFLNNRTIFFSGLLISIFLTACAIAVFITTPKKLLIPDNAKTKEEHLKFPFEANIEQYNHTINPVFNLSDVSAPKIPDLNNIIIFEGINKRPDMFDLDNPIVMLSLRGNNNNISLPIDQSAYISYNKNDKHYYFTPSGNLSIKCTLDKNILTVKAQIMYEKNNIADKNEYSKTFNIKMMPSNRMPYWKIDNESIDNSFLLRQKAHWHGKDLFIKTHGGEEFTHISNKQRIYFDREMSPYSLFVQEGESLIWKNGCWQQDTLSINSRQYPLLYIEKIEDRMMTVVIWSPYGAERSQLTIMKLNDTWSPTFIERQIHFIGFKTMSQAIIEVNNERMVVQPTDWLIHNDKKWTKIENENQIDDYLNNVLQGELLVFEGIEKKDSEYILQGHIFNKTKSEKHIFNIPMKTGLKQQNLYQNIPPESYSKTNGVETYQPKLLELSESAKNKIEIIK